MPSIYVYDSSQWGIFGLKYDKRIEIFSVADLVTKVLKELDQKSDLNELIFGGEGGADYQSVGANGLTDSTGDKSFQLDEGGNLKGGGGRYLPLLNGRIQSVKLYNLKEESKYVNLVMAIGKALGSGAIISTQNTSLKYYNDDSRLSRKITNEAAVDRDAMRRRLAEYTNG